MWKSEENPARESASLWLFVAVLIVLNLLLYLPALDNGFSLDDFNWLERAQFAPSWCQFVIEVEPGQVLNPVPRALVHKFLHTFGTNPLPFHLAVLALHLVNVGLLLVLVDRLVGSRTIAVLAALFFSLQTSYDEAVFWVSAFPHALSAGFCLATLLFARSYLESGKSISLILTGLGAIAGLLTKASFFVLLPLVLLIPGPRGRRMCLGVTSAGLIVVAMILNFSYGGVSSYLIDRDFFRPGIHMVTNLAEYLGWLALPFDAVAEWLGDPGILHALRQPLGWAVLVALILVAVRGPASWRPFVGLVIAPLVLVLPLVFDPASRYTYLPALGVATLGAGWLARSSRRVSTAGGDWQRSIVLFANRTPQRSATTPASPDSRKAQHLTTLRRPRHETGEKTGLAAGGGGALRSRSFRMSLLVALALLSLADTRLRDNVYEYRERLMATWVADVVTALPVPPPSGAIRIVGLPTLAIDPGIHLEAALRLAYDDPSVQLEVVPDDLLPTDQTGVLHFHAGRIMILSDGPAPDRREGCPSTTQIPGDHVPDVEQVDPQQGQPADQAADRKPPAERRREPDSEQDRTTGRQHEQVPALGLEVEPAVDNERSQQEQVPAGQPHEETVGIRPETAWTIAVNQPFDEPHTRSDRQRKVNPERAGVRQYLHPAEGAPPALEGKPEEREEAGLAGRGQSRSKLVESECAGTDCHNVRSTVMQDVSDEPRRGYQQGGCRGHHPRTQPRWFVFDHPDPACVQRNRQQEDRLDQQAHAGYDANPQRVSPSRQDQQQHRSCQLRGWIVADGNGHETAHGVEREEPGGGRGEPSVLRPQRPNDRRGDGHHDARQEQVEEPDNGDGSGQPEQQSREDVEKRRLVSLVGHLSDLRVRRIDAIEMAALEPVKAFRCPAVRSHLRQAAAVGDRTDVVEMGGLIRPIERRHRGQVPDGERRVPQDRREQPPAADDSCDGDSVTHWS